MLAPRLASPPASLARSNKYCELPPTIRGSIHIHYLPAHPTVTLYCYPYVASSRHIPTHAPHIMHVLSLLSATLLAMASTATAHTFINYPPPIGYTYGRSGDYPAPIQQGGICKGLHLSGPKINSQTPIWYGGKSSYFNIVGQHENGPLVNNAHHGGGSCQVSLSYDRGKTFTVIKSFIGGCPVATGNPVQGNQRFPFTIPADAPHGIALFAWSWFSRDTVNEMYHNCAWVRIKNNNRKGHAQFVASRPKMFVGYSGGGQCNQNQNRHNLVFPDPGKDIACGADANTVFKLPAGPGCPRANFPGGKPPCGVVLGRTNPNPRVARRSLGAGHGHGHHGHSHPVGVVEAEVEIEVAAEDMEFEIELEEGQLEAEIEHGEHEHEIEVPVYPGQN
ncbi:hypothetical protein EDC01DRAFT_665497 [Geopyxis carbonaria]|nr:hypothetical protein EDC01DRAFT_665497 [Geopyxis carbonaria]